MYTLQAIDGITSALCAIIKHLFKQHQADFREALARAEHSTWDLELATQPSPVQAPPSPANT